MSIFLNENSKVIVQGITGGEGTKHATKMLAAGTNIVGGVNARKAGTTHTVGGKDVTVYGTVEEAIKETGADVSVIFVPPKFAKDAVIEAIDAEIPLAVVITEGIPVHDSAYFWRTRSPRATRPGSSARTAPASSRPASPTRASSRRTSPARARSAWCRSPAR